MAAMGGNERDLLQQRLMEQISEKEITLWKSLKENITAPDGWKEPALAVGIPVIIMLGALAKGSGNILERVATGLGSLASNPSLIPAAAGLTLAGALGLAGVIVLQEHDGPMESNRIRQRLFDSPEVQGIIEAIADRTEDILAMQRGSVWIVSAVGQDPLVLTQQEYDARKKAEWPNIDEVRIDKDKVTVMRYTDGKLDAGVDRVMPAMEVFPISQGTLDLANKGEGWFAQGRKVSVDFLTERKARMSDDADMTVPSGLALA